MVWGIMAENSFGVDNPRLGRRISDRLDVCVMDVIYKCVLISYSGLPMNAAHVVYMYVVSLV